jgi:hypothetical protein
VRAEGSTVHVGAEHAKHVVHAALPCLVCGARRAVPCTMLQCAAVACVLPGSGAVRRCGAALLPASLCMRRSGVQSCNSVCR